ncbi:MAG: hypothetical protein KZQ57_04105, partial [gamma proteobacterium symbiont of Lucinoma myriamae]|nr:hypothetical protein [gamma proteobacterium symbiont of Lucinoma myriamae]
MALFSEVITTTIFEQDAEGEANKERFTNAKLDGGKAIPLAWHNAERKKDMKKRATVTGVLMAGLSIVLPGTVFSQHSFLKSGGVDDKNIAIAYYNTIDPDNLRPTQDAWLEVNGYNDPANEEIEVRGHFSDGDLAFWRSISLVNDKRAGYEGNIAFTTANYSTEMDALNGTNPISIVNMEYSPGPEDDLITKFYVFDVNTGERVTSTVFDNSREQLHLPAACFSCHGGDDDAEAPLPVGY